jgi:hypothetical protein
VQQRDPRALDLDDVLPGQRVAHGRLVHVPVHALERRPERAQLLEERRRDEVPGVQDQIRGPQALDASLGEAARAARDVRVGDDGDAARQPSVTCSVFVVVRSELVSAVNLTTTVPEP